MHDSLDKFWASAKEITLHVKERADIEKVIRFHGELPKKISALQKTVALANQEKQDGKAALAAFMKHVPPVKASAPLFEIVYTIFSLRFAAGAFAAVILLSGYTTYAAENSLPGDVFYDMKTKVLEPVRGVLWTFTPAYKAQWSMRLIERRLDELEELETRSNNTVDEDVVDKVINSAAAHMERFEEDAQTLPEKNVFIMRTELTDTVDRHTERLEKSPGAQTKLRELRRIVRRQEREVLGD